MALSSCCHTLFLLYHVHCSECLVKRAHHHFKYPHAVLLTNFSPCTGGSMECDRDTPALFYRFPITASIHYMCQTIYHDSRQTRPCTLSHCTMCFIIIIDLLFLLFRRLMMITFLALSIIVLLLFIWVSIKAKRASHMEWQGASERFMILNFSRLYGGWCCYP